MVSFKLKRAYVEALYTEIFKYLRLHSATVQRSIAGQPLVNNTLTLMVECALIAQLDNYFEKRLAMVKKPVVPISLPVPESICLYSALMQTPIHQHNVYLNMVRQAFIEKLYPALCTNGHQPGTAIRLPDCTL